MPRWKTRYGAARGNRQNSAAFRETTVTTKHLGEGIAADYDADGKLAGIEILDAIKRFGGKETLRQVVVEGLGPTQTT